MPPDPYETVAPLSTWRLRPAGDEAWHPARATVLRFPPGQVSGAQGAGNGGIFHPWKKNGWNIIPSRFWLIFSMFLSFHGWWVPFQWTRRSSTPGCSTFLRFPTHVNDFQHSATPQKASPQFFFRRKCTKNCSLATGTPTGSARWKNKTCLFAMLPRDLWLSKRLKIRHQIRWIVLYRQRCQRIICINSWANKTGSEIAGQDVSSELFLFTQFMLFDRRRKWILL